MQRNQANHGAGKRPGAENTGQSGIVKRVLVAYDGSAGADAALADLGRAGLPDALEALVLSVVEMAGSGNAAPFAQGERPAQQTIFRGAESLSYQLAELACGRLRTMFPRWQVKAAVVMDSPVCGIVRRAVEWKADLVVMGAHGQSCVERMLLGSVARKVFVQAPCSIRIARPSVRSHGRGLRVAVAISGSPADEAVIEAVAARQWPRTAEFQIVTVMDGRLKSAQASAQRSAIAWTSHSAEADARACRLMERHCSRLRAAGLHADTRIFEGDFADNHVQRARSWEADCLFIAQSGGPGNEQSLPSVPVFATAACAPCSVEVVKFMEQAAGPEQRHSGVALEKADARDRDALSSVSRPRAGSSKA